MSRSMTPLLLKSAVSRRRYFFPGVPSINVLDILNVSSGWPWNVRILPDDATVISLSLDSRVNPGAS